MTDHLDRAVTRLAPADAYDRGVADTLGLVRHFADLAPATLILSGARPPTMKRLGEIVAGIDRAQLRVLRPFDPTEALAPKQAAGIAGRSESTIRAWSDRYAIGRRMIGSLVVSRFALAMLLDDDPMALAYYLAGDRSSPVVTPYLTRLGLA